MQISNYRIPAKAETANIPTDRVYQEGDKVPCRDPFILLCGDKYFFYKGNGSKGICCSVSDDLKSWSQDVTVFSPPADFHGIKDWFWAPECHYYKGKFYIFTSVFSSRSGHRNISIYRADDPLGPFSDIAGGAVVKPEWDTIDGTFYVDEEGQPWLVFVHEWTSMPDGIGGMAVVKLKDDLTGCIGEPTEIFKAKDVAWACNRITDGPYLYKTDGGKLIMIWSNHNEKGYCVAKARSESGKIDGTWTHEDTFLYERGILPDCDCDGGHGMLFVDKGGRLMLALHTPNGRASGGFEHLLLKEVEERDGTLFLKGVK